MAGVSLIGDSHWCGCDGLTRAKLPHAYGPATTPVLSPELARGVVVPIGRDARSVTYSIEGFPLSQIEGEGEGGGEGECEGGGEDEQQPGLAVAGAAPTNGAASRDKLWPQGFEIRIAFLNGSALQHETIANTVKHWFNAEWPFNLRIRWIGLIRDAQRVPLAVLRRLAHVRITVRDDVWATDTANYSFVGTEALRHEERQNQTMHFGSAVVGAACQRTILHEFGHMIGLEHEHQSPASTLVFDTDAVRKHFRDAEGWDDRRIDTSVLRRHNAAAIVAHTAPDVDSIMMYGFRKEFIRGATRDIEAKTQLSAADKNFVQQLYPMATDPGLSCRGTCFTPHCAHVNRAVLVSFPHTCAPAAHELAELEALQARCPGCGDMLDVTEWVLFRCAYRIHTWRSPRTGRGSAATAATAATAIEHEHTPWQSCLGQNVFIFQFDPLYTYHRVSISTRAAAPTH